MNKNEVKYIDTSKETKDMLVKLSKQALKKSGKVITDILKNSVNVRTGGLKKSITAWAKINYKTGQPYLQVGYRSKAQMKKKYGIKYFVNPTWFEFGTKPHEIMTKEYKKSGKSSYELNAMGKKFGVIVKHPGMISKNFLRNTVFNNIEEIRKAQLEYLGKINKIIIKENERVDLGGDEEID